MSSRRSASLLYFPAVFTLSAAFFIAVPVSEAGAQEGDPDRPMVVGLVPGPVAAVDMFIKFDGIDGEAKDDKHDKWIDVLSMGWDNTSQARMVARPRLDARPRRGARAGDAEIRNLTFTKSYDAASPKLVEACANGTHMDSVLLEWTTTEGERVQYLKYELTNVMVTSYSLSAGEGTVPTESVTLNFAKVESRYIQEDQRGKTDGSWKVEEGER